MPRFLNAPTAEQQRALDLIQESYRAGHKGEPNVTRPDTTLAQALMASDTEDNKLPKTYHPSEFQRDPLVIGGGPSLAQEAKRLLDLDPGTKARSGSITYGPTAASMSKMQQSGLPMDTYRGTTLAGITQMSGHKIGLQEQGGHDDRLNTLAHEIGHVSGWDEDMAGRIGNAAGQGLSGPDKDESLKTALMIQEMKKARGR